MLQGATVPLHAVALLAIFVRCFFENVFSDKFRSDMMRYPDERNYYLSESLLECSAHMLKLRFESPISSLLELLRRTPPTPFTNWWFTHSLFRTLHFSLCQWILHLFYPSLTGSISSALGERVFNPALTRERKVKINLTCLHGCGN